MEPPGGREAGGSTGRRAWNLTKPATLESLSGRLDQIDAGGSRARLLYLAVTPSILGPAIDNLAGSGMLEKGDPNLLVDKPFGRDLESARALDRALKGRIPRASGRRAVPASDRVR